MMLDMVTFCTNYTKYGKSEFHTNNARGRKSLNQVTFIFRIGIPAKPSNLKFSEITMNTLKVSWDPPLKPNGEILGYIVAYETAEQDESKFERIKANDLLLFR